MTKAYDFKPYDDVLSVVGCDLFISPSGKYYKIGKMNAHNYMKSVSHEEWASGFLKQIKKEDKFTLKTEDILKIAHFPTEQNSVAILIQLYGYIYYSHDHILYQPIIEKPNPAYFGKQATEEQLDSLYMTMLYNKENVIDCPIFEENISGYVAYENRITYMEEKYETDFSQRFRKL